MSDHPLATGSRLALLCVALSGCPALDVRQPIALISDGDWTTSEVQILREAGACWNQEFGTQLLVDPPDGVAQRVEVSYSDFVCTYAGGRTESTPPVQVRICPPRYFFGLSDGASLMLFGVLIHELGHVLNIRDHADEPDSVMARSAEGRSYDQLFFPDHFSADDHRLFGLANPGAALAPPCARGVWIRKLTSAPSCSCLSG